MNKTVREQAIAWFTILNHETKMSLLEKYFEDRGHYANLTGREIEAIYLAENKSNHE